MLRPVAACTLLALVTAPVLAAEQKPVDFNRDVRPILSDNCFACHGPDEGQRKADLRLDVEESVKAERDGTAAVVPGKPEQSALVGRVTSDDPFTKMPPPDSGMTLSPQEVQLLRRWVAEGAKWSRHWAYVPPRHAPVPELENDDWSRNRFDRFVLQRLRDEGLSPAPEADRVTLIRRLSFDLTGLPPTPAEVDAFTSDDDPRAYERLVDRLLASPHFGERMAVYWLDLVRYADTVGYHGDQDHNASPYRDWVIDAFNASMPFDRFTVEQLAGDLLPDPTLEQRVATTYNRLLQTSHEGGVQPKEYLAMYAADRVRNLSAVWLGGTLGCAQCHDHKFDPYTMRDFYSMEAFFADVDEAAHFRNGGNTLPTRRDPEIHVPPASLREEYARLQARLPSLEAAQAQARRKVESLDARLTKRKKAKPEADGNEVAALEDQLAKAREELLSAKAELEPLQKRKAAIEKQSRRTMVTRSIKPRTMRILPRGNWLDDSGAIVQPAVPEFLGPLEVDGRASRLDLARWLVDDENGIGELTARVFANRVWALLLGVGIAKDLDDFGGQGEPPVHPELLDELALEFVDSGWDVKHLVKQVVTSATYRQSSRASEELRKRDPENRLYARQSRFRLPAEMVRDNALAVSGLLVRELGGASVKPYQPAGYYRHLNFPKRKYHAHTDSRQWRRGVYVHWQRQFLHPMLLAFDAPRREECTAQRSRSNTPLASLVLLNDPTFVEASRVFARRILEEGGDTDPERFTFAFRHALSRKPDDYERSVLSELLASARKRFTDDPDAAKRFVSTGLVPVETDDVAELAAWTEIARAVLNTSEAITRN